MRDLYPEIEPDDRGWLDVGDDHCVYWETCGRPQGRAVLVLHGGPGSGCTPAMRRFFDPNTYRIVLFDQRGCGRSTPSASEPVADLATNTTDHLLGDIERIRLLLGIDRWMIFGVSWGVTLGLGYAERHPSRVTEMVLVGVTMTRRSEIEWLYRGVAPLFPEAWAKFRDGVPEADHEGRLLEAYARRLHDPDPAVCEKAARDFHEWEAALLSADPNAPPPARWSDPEFRLARARIVTHYFLHAAWLDEGALLEGADALREIPGIMIHGRFDVAAPLVTAWELDRVWPAGQLVVVERAGHSALDSGMTEAAVAATDRFARRWSRSRPRSSIPPARR